MLTPHLRSTLLAQVVQQDTARRTPVATDTLLVVPNGRYDAGAMHRWMLGRGHRDLWATLMSAPVLDLSREAGGLRVTGLGGGLQTRSLQLSAADGRAFVFRTLDKDASKSLDPELRRTVVAQLLQDRVSSMLPVAALVVNPILAAGGVLHATARLVVMPDDPALGEYRTEFSGLIGLFEERPRGATDSMFGFADAEAVRNTRRMFAALEADPTHEVDVEAFLRARLLDFLVGDWDRHPDQWRWAAFADASGTKWVPIPRDRDWALSRMDGVVIRALRWALPHYIGFGPNYATITELSWSGRALDRPLLAVLPEERWRAIALDLEARISDSVIFEAVDRLPLEYPAPLRIWLRDALLSRRDGLVTVAGRLQALIAETPDVWMTDAPERAVLERLADGRLSLQVSLAEAAPHRAHVFDPERTREVRLYLRGGQDTVIVRGDGPADITVHAIGGGGADVFVDETSGRRVFFHDDRGRNVFSPGGDTRIDERRWEEPVDPASNTHQAPFRDWGDRLFPYPVFSIDPDVGVFVGAGVRREAYGFRAFPWKHRASIEAGWGATAGRARARAVFSRRIAAFTVLKADVRVSGAEVEHFHGFGNESPAALNGLGTRVFGSQWRTELGVQREFGTSSSVSAVLFGAGLDVGANEGTVAAVEQPHGFGRVRQLGVELGWQRITLDHPILPRRGYRLDVDAAQVRGLRDAPAPWGRARVSAAQFFSSTSPGDPVLGLRVRGERQWGTAPFLDAAAIGGAETVRGLPSRRFTGNHLLVGTAELRATVGDLFVLLPTTVGLMAVADVGRVFEDNERSRRWHTGVGGGVWLQVVSSQHVVSLVTVRSAEGTGLYARFGLAL